MGVQAAQASTSPVWRIFVVDDHPVVREGLAQRISRHKDLTVCGEAANARQALSAIPAASPDLVLVDINLPGRSGLELIRDLQAANPKLPILVLSMHDEAFYAERVLRAGARGYVSKQLGGQKLIEAIRRVCRGQFYLSEKINTRILDHFAGRQPRAGSKRMAQLTDRELEVLNIIGRGKESREVARELGMSLKTVETHRSNIKRKLNLKTGAELVRHAVLFVEASDSAGC